VRGLDFVGRVLGTPLRVPLGESFVVVATPGPGVRVEGGHLFYRVSGVGAAFDSVALTPLATDFIAAVPSEAVTERGVDYYLRVRNSGYTSTQPADAPAGFYTQDVAPAATMSVAPRPTSEGDFLEGRDIEVEVVLPDGAEFVSGELRYRRGGDRTFTTDTVTASGVLGRPVATIPGEAVGARGVEYQVTTRTHASDLRYPADTSEVAILQVKVQNLVETASHPAERYRLLSVPLDFGADISGSLDALLTDQFGPYDPTRWRAYRYDPDSLRNLEFSVARAAAFRPRPGRGFWLVTRAEHRVDTAPLEGLSTPTGGPVPIALSPGWNMFGNPFAFPVAWSDVVRDPGAVGAPVAFDPNLGVAGDYALATPTVLAPFEAYFVENTGAFPETLWVPPVAFGALPLAHTVTDPEPARVAAADDPWTLALTASTANATDAFNRLGVDPSAADGPDPLDLRKAPRPPGPWVQAGFVHPEWDVPPGLYRRDMRAPGDGHAWDTEVRSAGRGERVTVEVAAATSLPPGLVIAILDRETGSRIGPAEPSARIEFLSPGADRPYRLTVFAGTPSEVARMLEESRSIPPRPALDAVAPNPFRAATRVRFGLARPTRVSVAVYSVLGERVATLVDGRTLDAGYHSFLWDGTTAGGRAAPSGVYLLRLEAGDERLTTRLVRVR